MYAVFPHADYYALFDCLQGLVALPGAALAAHLPLSFPSLSGSPVFTMEDSNKML